MNIREPGLGPEASGGAIEALAGAIQKLQTETRWLQAAPDLIGAKATGIPMQFGPRTRMAASILRFAPQPSIARFVACAFSFALLLGTYFRQLISTKSRSLRPSIFVGVGALRERSLIDNLARERDGEVSFLNETQLASFSSVFEVSFWALWPEWLSVVRAAWKQLGNEDSSVGLPPSARRIVFLVQAHKYSYFRAWFRCLGRKVDVRDPVVFSAASTVAYAAVSVGVRVAYHLHGFQRRSLVYPDFDEVVCFTDVEARHIGRRLPRARVSVAEERFDTIVTQKSLVIAGCYGQASGFDECRRFVEWASDEAIPVVVRIHPLDTSGFFLRWQTDPNVTLVDTSEPIDAFLDRWRPRLLVSWYSTALFDALRRGVVPVTVTPEAWRSADVVFPFREISLALPEDRSRIVDVLSNEDARREWLDRKRKLAGIGSSAE